MGGQASTTNLVGELAPDFSLASLQGEPVRLAAYRGSRRVILWFSRGYQCPFCRSYMERIAAGYDALNQEAITVIQVAPNLVESARAFFEGAPPVYPFVCDPDKRLFALYGLGDRGVLEATRSTVVSLIRAAEVGEIGQTARALWLDTANRNFLRRLNHHALTAMEQGLFVIDRQGVVRWQTSLGTIDPIPDATGLLALVRRWA